MKQHTVGMISLGCAKNLVDAEVMLGDAVQQGFKITAHPDEADLLIVNTCGFIDSAKQESIDAILEAHENRKKQSRGHQKLIVSGCMAQRFSSELAREIPEVDAIVGLDQIEEMGSLLRGLLEKDSTESPINLVTRAASQYIPDYDTPRFRLTPLHSAYLKIAEGCNHPCSFCVIPRMRGRHRSRTISSVIEEVKSLVNHGVKEINLISQDTTYFGMDLWKDKASPRQPIDSQRGPTLSKLLDEIAKIEGTFWIRLLYTHPAHWSDELIEAIARNPKVVPYVDMPLQHIHEDLLNAMRRETSRRHIEDLIGRLRVGIPQLAIRTTFIVGFPGETEEHFQSLLDFIGATRFERLGVFTYSQEEGSRAAKMEKQVPTAEKNRRVRRAMTLQQQIAREIAQSQVGKQVRVLVEAPHTGRTMHDAPEVDCKVILTHPSSPGKFIDARVIDTQVYDLVATPID